MFFIKPIKTPGDLFVDFRTSFLTRIQGSLGTQVDVIRSVAGLALPYRCTVVNGNGMGLPVGSCTYSDFCRDVVQDLCKITPTNCPEEFAEYGIDCTCPFNIPAQTIDDIYQYDIPDLRDFSTDPFCPLFFLVPGVT